MQDSFQVLLTDILKGVSRSFYLSLKILPGPLRRGMSIGYILARAADTIADTQIVPRERRIEFLQRFRKVLESNSQEHDTLLEIRQNLSGSQSNPAERGLLERLPDALGAYRETESGDQTRLRFVLSGLIQGMIEDLEYFPGNSPNEMKAFDTLEDLDHYTYHAAGIVGEFWTEMSCAHLSSLSHWDYEKMKSSGIRFGKALQMVNVIKDAPRDLRSGRCYFPKTLLDHAGLAPEDLLEPAIIDRFRPILNHLTQLALDHFEVAREYLVSIPLREIRLRLSCIWPLWIGLRSLSLLLRSDELLDPHLNLRISRSEVYRLLRTSLAAVCSNSLSEGYTISYRNEVEEVLHAASPVY